MCLCVKESGENAENSTYEVYTDGGDEGLCEGVVRKAKEERRLTDSRISDEEELEEVITGMKRGEEIRPPEVSLPAFGERKQLRGNCRRSSEWETYYSGLAAPGRAAGFLAC